MDPELPKFLTRLEAMVRQAIAWNPEASHASVSATGPDQRAYTAYAKREGPGDLSTWIRPGGTVEPLEHERDRYVVAQEKMRPRPMRPPKTDPRIWR